MNITVFGLGFVGLTTALGLAEYGNRVYGIEGNSERLAVIRSGRLPFMEPGMTEPLRKHLHQNFFPTDRWEKAVAESSIIYYCVGTPYGADGEADLSALYQALQQTLDVITDDRFRVFVIKSTIPPLTTQQRIIPFIKAQGKRVPEELGVANNPEFLREGHCWEDFIHADRIVLGVSDKRSETMLRELYQNSGIPVFCVSPNTGEFIKYLSNTVLACLISYANEMSLAADAIGGIDIAEAFQILHMDHRWQNGGIRNYFYPGCGYGGSCLPKDTNAFCSLTSRIGAACGILKQVIKVNDGMPEATAERIIKMAGPNRAVRIGILGLSFNPGSDDVRETPSARIIQALNARGYEHIYAYDPAAMEAFQKSCRFTYCCVDSLDKILEIADLFAVVTAWAEFSELPKKTKKPIVDCRYSLKKFK